MAAFPSSPTPAANQRQVPPPVGALLARLPAYPGSMLLVTALNLALARHLPDDVGRLLLHKKMRVQVRDGQPRLVRQVVAVASLFLPRDEISLQVQMEDLT